MKLPAEQGVAMLDGMRLLMLIGAGLISCGPPHYDTAADACYELSSTLCNRLQQCGVLQGSIADCRSQGVAICCDGADCSKPVTNQAFVANCDNALRNLTCGQIAAGLKPTACNP